MTCFVKMAKNLMEFIDRQPFEMQLRAGGGLIVLWSHPVLSGSRNIFTVEERINTNFGSKHSSLSEQNYMTTILILTIP